MIPEAIAFYIRGRPGDIQKEPYIDSVGWCIEVDTMVLIGAIERFDRDRVKRENFEKVLYEVLDGNEEVLYVGVGNIRINLMQHMPEGWFPLPEAKYYRKFATGEHSLLVERKKSLIDDYTEILGHPPKYNEKEMR